MGKIARVSDTEIFDWLCRDGRWNCGGEERPRRNNQRCGSHSNRKGSNYFGLNACAEYTLIGDGENDGRTKGN